MITQKTIQQKTIHQNNLNKKIQLPQTPTIYTESTTPCWALLYNYLSERRHGRIIYTEYHLYTSYLSEDFMNFIRTAHNEGIATFIHTPQGDLHLDDYRAYDYTGYAPAFLKLSQLQRELNEAARKISEGQALYQLLSQMKRDVQFQHSDDYLIRKLRKYIHLFNSIIPFKEPLNTSDQQSIARALEVIYNLSFDGPEIYRTQLDLIQGFFYLDHGIKPMRPEQTEELPWYIC